MTPEDCTPKRCRPHFQLTLCEAPAGGAGNDAVRDALLCRMSLQHGSCGSLRMQEELEAATADIIRHEQALADAKEKLHEADRAHQDAEDSWAARR